MSTDHKKNISDSRVIFPMKLHSSNPGWLSWLWWLCWLWWSRPNSPRHWCLQLFPLQPHRKDCVSINCPFLTYSENPKAGERDDSKEYSLHQVRPCADSTFTGGQPLLFCLDCLGSFLWLLGREKARFVSFAIICSENQDNETLNG